MLRTTRLRHSLLLVSFFFLSACGGGGDGGDSGSGGSNPPPSNLAPTSDAGADATVNEQTSVTLSGSGADSDGSVASYSWTQNSGTAVNLNGADSTSATFDAPITTSQLILTFRLTVTDNEGATGSDTVSVTVDPVNATPTALAGADEVYPEGSFFSLSGAGSDTDGTIASGAWTQVSGSLVTFESPNELQTGVNISSGVQGETLVFRLEVTDNEGATAADEKSVIVEPALPFVDYTGDEDPDPLTDVVINLVDTGNSQLVPAENSIDGYTTIVVNSTDTYNFVVADDSLTVTGTGLPAVAIGDIIVGVLADESGGYAREVTAIDGDILSTKAASLSEAFPNAELNLSISLSNDIVATTASVKNGGATSVAAEATRVDILNFDRKLQYEIRPGIKTVTNLSMNSQFDVDFRLSILERSITEMSTVISANYSTAAYLDVDLEKKYSRKIKKTFKPIFDKTAVIYIGVVPVLVNVKAIPVVGAGINMSASGSFKYGFRVGGDLRAGFQYRNSAITNIAEFAPLMNKIGPQYVLAGGVKLNSQASVAVIVTLYDINVGIPAIAEFEFSGPGLGIDLGPNAQFSVEAEYDSQATPQLTCALDLSVGISSNLDIEYGTIGSQLGIANPKSISLYKWNNSLWSSDKCPFGPRVGGLTGAVTDSASAALGDVLVQVQNDSGTVVAETTSVGSGQYQIDEIAIGPYDVVYSKQEYKQAVANLVVQDSETVDLPIVLVRDGVGVLRISVTEEGVPATLLADASVTIREGLNSPTGSFVTREFSATTPVDIALDAGYYTLEVEKEGFDNVIQSVSVENGGVVNMTIGLPSGTGEYSLVIAEYANNYVDPIIIGEYAPGNDLIVYDGMRYLVGLRRDGELVSVGNLGFFTTFYFPSATNPDADDILDYEFTMQDKTNGVAAVVPLNLTISTEGYRNVVGSTYSLNSGYTISFNAWPDGQSSGTVTLTRSSDGKVTTQNWQRTDQHAYKSVRCAASTVPLENIGAFRMGYSPVSASLFFFVTKDHVYAQDTYHFCPEDADRRIFVDDH